jgi:toxin ParE1/3/4
VSRELALSGRAQRQLLELWDFIANESYPDRADGYVTRILRQCEVLTAAPSLGEARDDVLPGLRIMGFERRAIIAFESTDDVLLILGVYYGGQDWERQLRS